jgi:hypothetical protein
MFPCIFPSPFLFVCHSLFPISPVYRLRHSNAASTQRPLSQARTRPTLVALCCAYSRSPSTLRIRSRPMHSNSFPLASSPSPFSFVLSLVQHSLPCAVLTQAQHSSLVQNTLSTHTTTKSSILLQWFRVLFALSHPRLLRRRHVRPVRLLLLLPTQCHCSTNSRADDG